MNIQFGKTTLTMPATYRKTMENTLTAARQNFVRDEKRLRSLLEAGDEHPDSAAIEIGREKVLLGCAKLKETKKGKLKLTIQAGKGDKAQTAEANLFMNLQEALEQALKHFGAQKKTSKLGKHRIAVRGSRIVLKTDNKEAKALDKLSLNQ